MSVRPGRYQLRTILSYVGVLFGVFLALAGSGAWGLSRINAGLLRQIESDGKSLDLIKTLRLDFVSQHNAITYGLSKSVSDAKAIYEASQSRIQHSFERLRQEFTLRRERILVDNAIYSQTMFSDQIIQLFDYLQRRRNLSLTYDELIDLKSYPVRALNEAGNFADQFNARLDDLEKSLTGDLHEGFARLIGVFRSGVLVFCLLMLALFVGLSIASANLVIRSRRPLSLTAGLIASFEKGGYRQNIDYGRIEDDDVRYILKTFNTSIADVRNFITVTGEGLALLRSRIESVTGRISELLSLEREQYGVSAGNQRILLDYSQTLENTRFFFDRIREAASRLAEDRQGLEKDVQPVIRQFDAIEANTREIREGLSRFVATAEQTSLLAFNSSLEASKGGEHGGALKVADEVRRLTATAADHAKAVDRLADASRTLYADSRTRLLGTERYFTDISRTFNEIEADIVRVEEVKDCGFTAERALMENNAKLARLINDIGLALGELEQTNRVILKKIDEIVADSKGFTEQPAEQAILTGEHAAAAADRE